MRSISLLSQLEFNFSGNVARNALTLGDADNDQDIELVIGSENGELAFFKGNEKRQKITDFSFITCIAIGDILNVDQNCVVVVTADGWCYFYYCPPHVPSLSRQQEDSDVDVVDGLVMSSESAESNRTIPLSQDCWDLRRVHVQRIPANTMNIVIGDIDGDNLMEIVFGLTDRVVRSYRWLGANLNCDDLAEELKNVYWNGGSLSGQLVGLNKWECANQIGSITLHRSLDGKPCLLVSQPGGTFMRITPADETLIEDIEDANEKVEKGMESSVDYQFLGINRMRNQIVHTEILGDLNNAKLLTNNDENKSKPYSLTTLDGTVMLVQDEVILWAMAVDHQIFALEKIDIREKSCDDVVCCTWDGYTYILDQERNVVRFQVGESIQAFCCGHYSLSTSSIPSTCLVYVTFKNKIRLYYDIPLAEMVTQKFEPESVDDPDLRDLFSNDDPSLEDSSFKRKLVEYVLYGIKS